MRAHVISLCFLLALPALGETGELSATVGPKTAAPIALPPHFKPSKYSKAPIDITTNAYGAFDDASRAPRIGDVVDDFTLPIASGGKFRLSEATAKGDVLLIFYRGHW